MTAPYNLEADFGSVGGDASVSTTGATETRVTLQYDTAQGNVDIQGGLVGTTGRQVTLTAYPRTGYVFSYWETVSAPALENITFGVFTGQGTINGRARPFVQSVPLGTAIAVDCIPAAGYQFDKAETFDAAGNSLARIIQPSFTVYANGQLEEVRAYFTSTAATPESPTQEPLGTTTETTDGRTGVSTTTTYSTATGTDTVSPTGRELFE